MQSKLSKICLTCTAILAAVFSLQSSTTIYHHLGRKAGGMITRSGVQHDTHPSQLPYSSKRLGGISLEITDDIYVHYINLKSRPDRRKSIVHQLSMMGIPFSRLDAVDVRENKTALLDCFDQSTLNKCAGRQGVKESHVKVLKKMKEHHDGDQIVLVFEDDFVWLPHVDPLSIPTTLKGFVTLFPDWKVIGLSMNILAQQSTNVTVDVSRNTTSKSRVLMINKAQCAHGFAVRASFLPVLLQTFTQCDVKKNNVAIDTCWFSLQAEGGWYGFSPQLGAQKPSYSDIEAMNVSYQLRTV